MTDEIQARHLIGTMPSDPGQPPDPSPIEGFPEHAQYIGLIIAEWNQIEFKLASVLAIGLGLTSAHAIPMIYQIESSGARLEMIRAAIPSIFEGNDQARELASRVLDKAQKLLVQRNNSRTPCTARAWRDTCPFTVFAGIPCATCRYTTSSISSRG